MDQSERSPDDLPPPRSLTERLKAEANGHLPAAEELTPSLMARRFAPDAPAVPPDARLDVQAPQSPMFGLPAREPWGMRTLIAVLILVALVPSVTLGAMVGLGMIATPWATTAPPHDGRPSALEQASVTATLAPATILPKQDVEVPVVALTAPATLEAEAGKEIAFPVALDGTDALPARSIMTVSGLPAGSTFSAGRPYGQTEWSLRADEIGDLNLALPDTASGVAKLKLGLVTPDGRIIASTDTALTIAADPKSALVLRPQESALIADLIAHGNKMVDVGYFPGARAYFQRAAEAGSGEAALALGLTYDPGFIEKIGAQGIKPEPEQAQAWYERAAALGAQGAEAKLAELKVAAKAADADSDPPPVIAGVQPASLESVGPEQTSPAEPAAGMPVAVTPSAGGPVGGPPAGGPPAPEWVELTVSANVRESPSSNATTVRVMEGGTKLHEIGRKGGWVQVTNPATAETGWVYSRYVASAAQ
jgi:Bacterial SH3 domain